MPIVALSLIPGGPPDGAQFAAAAQLPLPTFQA
jgi:hypothetical protein